VSTSRKDSAALADQLVRIAVSPHFSTVMASNQASLGKRGSEGSLSSWTPGCS
jgi:hypothetical protein